MYAATHLHIESGTPSLRVGGTTTSRKTVWR